MTNATTRLADDLERLGIDGEVDHVVNSAALEVAKPHPAVYGAALDAAGAAAGEPRFVDDSAPNVRASTELGIGGHVYRGPSGLERVLRARGLLPSAGAPGLGGHGTRAQPRRGRPRRGTSARLQAIAAAVRLGAWYALCRHGEMSGEIAAVCRTGASAVSRVMGPLEDAGLVRVRRGGGPAKCPSIVPAALAAALLQRLGPS